MKYILSKLICYNVLIRGKYTVIAIDLSNTRHAIIQCTGSGTFRQHSANDWKIGNV